MHIDWEHFTPAWSLAGGLLIGLAAAILILFNGRIAGISGIVGGLLRAGVGERGWHFWAACCWHRQSLPCWAGSSCRR